MERQIAPGFRSRAPEKICRQSQTAIPFNNHRDAVRAESSSLTGNSAEAEGIEPII
jgi:hypothetical protein